MTILIIIFDRIIRVSTVVTGYDMMYPPSCIYLPVLLTLTLWSELRLLSEKQKVPVDLDTYIKKLANSRKRIMLVNDILQNVQVQYC